MFDPFINVCNVPDHSAVSSRQGLTQSNGRTKASNASPDSRADVPIFRWSLLTIPEWTRAVTYCHDRDIPPQPSHTYSCLLAVQTPPEHSLTKPEPIPGLPNPSIAFPNSSAAFLKGCCTNICLVSIPEAVNTIPEHI